MGATGESVKRLTDFGYNPAWSPDGSEIAYATEAGDDPTIRASVSELWRVVVATGDKNKLTEGDAVQPSWSPDGHRIAYWNSQRDIWTIPADGGTPIPVTNDGRETVDWNPVWSRDGRWLYFGSDRGGRMNLWRVAVDEASGRVLGAEERLTAGGAGMRGPMSLSADGRRVAYVERTDNSNVERIRFDSNQQAVTGSPEPVTRGSLQVDEFDVSPDGEWLAFNSVGSQEDIYLVRTDGGGLRQLTEDPAKDRSPRWSPDGKRIAFFSARGGQYEVWSIDADGTGLRQLTNMKTDGVGFPTWSPDGSRLSFNDNTSNVSYMVDLSESGDPALPQVIPPQTGAGTGFVAMDWSPDGSRIAGFTRRPDGVIAGIVTYSIANRAFERLTETGVYPRWLSDGDRLVYTRADGTLSVVENGSRRSKEVLSLLPDKIFYPVPSPDDRWLYFDRVSAEGDLWLLTLR